MACLQSRPFTMWEYLGHREIKYTTKKSPELLRSWNPIKDKNGTRFLSQKHSKVSPHFPDIYRLLLKEGKLHGGKHGLAPYCLRHAAAIKLKMSQYFCEICIFYTFFLFWINGGGGQLIGMPNTLAGVGLCSNLKTLFKKCDWRETCIRHELPSQSGAWRSDLTAEETELTTPPPKKMDYNSLL